MPSVEVLSALPIFPLPNVVFLPGMVLPLNVFEPRYLDLVDHVMETGTGHIGVPLLAHSPREPGIGATIEPVFGLGRLVFHRRLPDGRRFIRLEGLGRARMLEELPQEHRFRQVRAHPLHEDPPQDQNAFAILKAQIERMARTFDDEDREMVHSILRLEDQRVVTYAIAALIPNVELMRAGDLGLDHDKRCPQLNFQQSCLSAEKADERVDLLLQRSATLITELADSGRFPSAMMN